MKGRAGESARKKGAKGQKVEQGEGRRRRSKDGSEMAELMQLC